MPQREARNGWMRECIRLWFPHIEEHSRKPGEVHERIRRLMGDVPKIELFARRKAEGFDVWGNEVDSDIEFKGGNRLCS